jgi:hypothetical protein
VRLAKYSRRSDAMAPCTTGLAQEPKPNSQCGRLGCCSQAKTSRSCCFQANPQHPSWRQPMVIAGRRWIANVGPWSCIATSTGIGIWSTLRIELALHLLSHVNIHLRTIFLASAGLLLEGCGPACISKEQAMISDPSGLTFVITETNCDLVGNTTATTIEAYGRVGSRTTLFKYGPDDRRVGMAIQ